MFLQIFNGWLGRQPNKVYAVHQNQFLVPLLHNFNTSCGHDSGIFNRYFLYVGTQNITALLVAPWRQYEHQKEVTAKTRKQHTKLKEFGVKYAGKTK